ncbi:MAG TPA: thermonuclease family protein [Candidatus Nitrosotenuis sp.]|nr:thermonuclease family protein [Candidatus Nitrosotenuis sp.]
MKTKTVGILMIVIGMMVLFTLIYGSSKIDSPKIDVPRTSNPIVSSPMMDNSNPDRSEITGACVGNALCTTDKVIQIVDGDTIYTQNYKIRLSLTDTPEKNEVGFSEATAFTRNLCPVGSIISIDQDDKQKTDKYGRMVAKITCSGRNLNAELLENNHGQILDQYCMKSEFASETWAIKFGC